MDWTAIIVAAIINGVGFVALWIKHIEQAKKIQEIHVLVNDRLERALGEISRLTKLLQVERKNVSRGT